MDLSQRKLTRQEWESIETQVSPEEKKILSMIIESYGTVNIRSNDHLSLFSFVKIERTSETERFLYQKYFHDIIQDLLTKYGKGLNIKLQTMENTAIKRLKSGDNIRIQNLEANIQLNRSNIFEFLLIELSSELLLNLSKKEIRYAFYLYTLLQLRKTNIKNINIHVLEFVDKLTEIASKYTQISSIIQNAYDFIEKNPYLLKYEDKSLFSHQKELFTLCQHMKGDAKLILYTAPTGTGKTLSPIGLSNQYRIIFVCVARHVGLALAKSAISMEKKVAFAFGCETSSDIRLHYFAAVNYVKNKRSGAIAKVDNSEGSKVEIMICDVQSYLTSMHYMLAFNKPVDIITYWDEPTITMDYEKHELHEIIHRNWKENKIPNMILSCATLPKEHEIIPVIQDFRCKFDNAEIRTITSYDCKKSISILSKEGKCVLPHLLYKNYRDLHKCVRYCDENKTLLRYFDLPEIIRFIEYVNDEELIQDAYSIDEYFSSGISDITMNSLKIYYLDVLKHIEEKDWSEIYNHMVSSQKTKYKNSSQTIRKTQSVDIPEKKISSSNVLTRINSVSAVVDTKPIQQTQQTNTSTAAASAGILLTTRDAHTLTDGPTIFITEDVNKIGNFYIQQSNISSTVFQSIMCKIVKNNDIVQQIERLESLIKEKQEKSFDATSKNQKSSGLIQKSDPNKDVSSSSNESERLTVDSQKFMDEIHKLRKEIRMVSLDPMYVPNTKPHQQLWTPTGDVYSNAFLPSIDEETAKTIMTIDIENNLKVLLLLGIGLFLEKPNVQYMEIMKRLADNQRLFIIIASSDYIYGTNYQFCHGFIGKDLVNMTQQKTLQAMGRIGRNNIQQEYTVRFRDDAMIQNLFQYPENNIEANNMCALFSSS